VLDAVAPDVGLPPASTLKAVTSLYALDRLGPDWRYRTGVYATGPLENGIVQGDLVLVGSGDPTMDTDRLLLLAEATAARGVRGVTGRFLVWDGYLPDLDYLAAGQPEQVGYNPAVSGLNLNFNRVHFSWERTGSGYDVEIVARGLKAAPDAGRLARVAVADRAGPVYEYHGNQMGRDQWSVARSALGKEGSRWLPVREPGLYCGHIFQELAAAEGVRLPTVTMSDEEPRGGVRLASVSGQRMRDVLREMMRYSTNLTAEVTGMTASLAGGAEVGDLSASGAAMKDWAEARYGVRGVTFQDHSGLGYDSRVTASAMVTMLLADPAVRPLMKGVNLDLSKSDLGPRGVSAVAKTGTLNFVSSLVGYVLLPSGRDLTFAILTGDIARRDAVPMDQRERPDGGRGWANRSRTLQKRLIRSWSAGFSA
jgi:D-alanyl-D-alanine carboxypeptidase/D-alanyl-D-alanine-endopeptidase (penicillin-binding protein 4)